MSDRKPVDKIALKNDLTKALEAAMAKIARKHKVELENLVYSCDIVTRHDVSGSVCGGY